MSRDWLIAGALFLLALALNLGAVERSPFHPDETRWLNRAHYLRDVADPFGPTWADGYLTRGQPPLASYLMGAGLSLQGRDLVTNGIWDFHHDVDWNQRHDNMADPADLAAGRRTNAVVGALAVACVYLAARHLTHRAGAVAGALLLATHPLMVTLSSQALSDALLALWLAAAILAGIKLAQRPGWGRALALGVALGLGGATKLSPLLITLPLAALGGALVLRSRAPAARSIENGTEPHEVLPGLRMRRLGRQLLATPLIAAVVFVAVYPYLWLDPVGRTVALFTFRAEEMGRQGANWAGVAVGSQGEAMLRIGERLGNDYSGVGQIAGWLRGADLALGLAGLLVLAALAPRPAADRRYQITLVLLGGMAGVIMLGMRSDYARYHLPLVLVMCLGVCIASGEVWRLLVPGVAQIGRIAEGLAARGSVPAARGRVIETPGGHPAEPHEVLPARGSVPVARWNNAQRAPGAEHHEVLRGGPLRTRAPGDEPTGLRNVLRGRTRVRLGRRAVAAAPSWPRLGWGAAGLVLTMIVAGSALGDDLPEITALPATPASRATPVAGAAPVGTPSDATPLAGVASPVAGRPAATPQPPASTPARAGE